MGSWLGHRWWGSGANFEAKAIMAALAFRRLGLERLTAWAGAGNGRSQAALERIGFRREGVLAAWHRHGDRALDVVVYGMVRAAWERSALYPVGRDHRGHASAGVHRRVMQDFFEHMYAEGNTPWDRGAPRALLVEWARDRDLRGEGRRALVVGAGLGWDAEYVASLGFATVAFDFAPSAVRMAVEAHPGSPVSYVVADVLDPPPEWAQAFDLVVECLTVQSLPPAAHERAGAAIAGFLAPGGTLIVLASADDGTPPDGPPWPLTRLELHRLFAGLHPRYIERLHGGDFPRWRAEYGRPPAP